MEDITCRDLVEKITDFLEDALSDDEVAKLREHLSSCDGCQAHLDQMRATVRLLESMRDRLAPPMEEALIRSYREFITDKAGSGS